MTHLNMFCERLRFSYPNDIKLSPCFYSFVPLNDIDFIMFDLRDLYNNYLIYAIINRNYFDITKENRHVPHQTNSRTDENMVVKKKYKLTNKLDQKS